MCIYIYTHIYISNKQRLKVCIQLRSMYLEPPVAPPGSRAPNYKTSAAAQTLAPPGEPLAHRQSAATWRPLSRRRASCRERPEPLGIPPAATAPD